MWVIPKTTCRSNNEESKRLYKSITPKCTEKENIELDQRGAGIAGYAGKDVAGSNRVGCSGNQE